MLTLERIMAEVEVAQTFKVSEPRRDRPCDVCTAVSKSIVTTTVIMVPACRRLCGPKVFYSRIGNAATFAKSTPHKR